MVRGGAYFTNENVVPAGAAGLITGLATRNPWVGIATAAATPAVINTFSGRNAFKSKGRSVFGGNRSKCGMRGGASYKCGMRGGASYKCGMRGGDEPVQGGSPFKCGMRGGYAQGGIFADKNMPLTGGRSPRRRSSRRRSHPRRRS